MIAAIIAGATGLIAGAAVGVLLTIRATRTRNRQWMRWKCRDAAKTLQAYFGDPVSIGIMSEQIGKGHDYRSDKVFRIALRSSLERAFNCGGES